MRRFIAALPALVSLFLVSTAFAQPPRPGQPGSPQRDTPANQASPTDRLMQFDANGDGILSAEELTDRRLHRLLTAVDANSDGSLSRAELTGYFEKQAREVGGNRGPMGGLGGERPGGGFPGPGRPPFPGGPGRPGQILPEFLQQQLNLSDEQRKELSALQTRVDEQLARILTEEQQQQLRRMTPPRGERPTGPEGPGGPRPGRPAADR